MFRLGIIGCGSIVEQAHLPAAVRSSRITVTDLVDQDYRRAQELAKRFSVPARISTDYDELPERVDGVLIAVPNHLHFSVSQHFLEEGVPVLCEKPLSLRVEEAEDLVELSTCKGALLAVGYHYRFSPATRIVELVLKSNLLGDLRGFEFESGHPSGWQTQSGYELSLKEAGGGVLLINGIHFLDRMLHWFGPVREFVYRDDSHGGPEANAAASFVLDFRGKPLKGEVKLSRSVPLRNQLKIFGSNASLEMTDHLITPVRVQPTLRTGVRTTAELDEEGYPTTALGVFQAQLENFASSVERSETPEVSGKDSLRSLALIESCYRCRQALDEPWRVPSPPRISGAVRASLVNRVLVTGATGFIGGALCERLCHEKQVRALVHTSARASRILRLPLETIRGDLLSREQAAEAVKGCDAVIHLAAGTREVIVEGTENLLQACIENSVRRVVVISSVRVYGPNPGPETQFESAKARKTGDSYGDAKLQEEHLALKYHHRHGLPVVILRPPYVYGPYDSFSTNLITKLRKGQWVSFDGGRGVLNAVFVENLVDAILLALVVENAIGEALFVTDGHPIEWRQCIEDYQRMLGPEAGTVPEVGRSIAEAALKARESSGAGSLLTSAGKYLSSPSWNRRLAQWPLPTKLKRRALHLFGEILPRLRESLREDSRFREVWLANTSQNTHGVDPYDDQLMSQLRKVVHSCDRARDVLGYRPSFDRSEALRLTETWLRSTSYLDTDSNGP